MDSSPEGSPLVVANKPQRQRRLLVLSDSDSEEQEQDSSRDRTRSSAVESSRSGLRSDDEDREASEEEVEEEHVQNVEDDDDNDDDDNDDDDDEDEEGAAEISHIYAEADEHEPSHETTSLNTSSIIIEKSDAEEDDDTDARIEERCYSPRTRQSMGIGRQDLGTDSEEEEEGYEDDGSAAVHVPESDEEEQVEQDQEQEQGSPSKSVVNDSIVAEHADSEEEIVEIGADVQSSTMRPSLAQQITNVPGSPRTPANNRSLLNRTDGSEDVAFVPNVREETVVLSSEDDMFDSPAPAAASAPAASGREPLRQLPPPQLVQPKITSFTPKGKQLKYVSASFMAAEQKKRWDMQTQLENNKKLLATLHHTLPDNGAALRARIPRLADQLAEQDRYIQTLRVDDQLQAPPLMPPDDWSKISAAINAIQPEHTGSQGLKTFNNQKALTVDRLKQLHASLETCPAEDQLAETPKGLRVELMEHQRYALSWMKWREKQKPRGGILADDMGLGKTLTMISLVLMMSQREDVAEGEEEQEEEESSDSDASNEEDDDADRRKSLHHGGTLVVCPASLINQWEGEVGARLRRNLLNVVVHHGTKRDVRAKYLARNDIVITTYAIVAREHKDRGALYGIKWARIILDEAHVIRNHKSKQSEACTRLRGTRRWSLTGTPIQNKEMDIYAQLRFLRCSPFDDLVVYKKWIGNQSAGNQERMNNIIRPMMLRRTKAQLQEKGSLQGMPSKTVETVRVPLDKDEMNVYQRVLTFSKTLFGQFMHQRAERHNDMVYRDVGDRPAWQRGRDQPNEAYDRMHQRVKKWHGQPDIKSHQILTYILRLRQICCHPGLIDAMLEENDGTTDLSEDSASLPEVDLLEQLNKLNLNDESRGSQASGGDDSLSNSRSAAITKASSKLLLRSNPVFNVHRPSSKFRLALNLLRDRILPASEKVVVVSQWTSVLDMFREHLDATGIRYVRLTGAVAVKDRNPLVVEFNNRSSGVQVMLLSLTAGGVGLNLIGGNHLMLLDPHWNPQLEAQAQDRVYRVGQTKPVMIYRFLCADTIEERIDTLQQKKLSLASDMLNGVKHTGGSKLTIDDMKALFEM